MVSVLFLLDLSYLLFLWVEWCSFIALVSGCVHVGTPFHSIMRCSITVCAKIFAVLNFRGCITLRIFADYIFAVVGQIIFIFQFEMFELESCIRGFQVYYVSWTLRKGEVLHCASEIANREDPYVVAFDILSKFKMNNNTRILDQCFI